MNRVRFVMIGGFLGAGKTTTIARLARHYVEQGERVGVVTNDQAYELVDTRALRAQGFAVGEVPGACFCCKFNDLVATAAELAAAARPTVVLAEPVGSCTDLVATVVEPLAHLHGGQYEIAPFAVLLKPEHGEKILGGAGAGFSPKAAYIFLKQIEEADLVVINKIDKLDADQQRRLVELVGERFPEKTVLAASARTGAGFPKLIEALSRQPQRRGVLEIDYDVYAAGEAELGWLNCSATLRGPAFDLDDFLVELIGGLRGRLSETGAEPAHLKVLGLADGETAIANLVASEAAVELSLASHARVKSAELVVNARVAGDPEVLRELVAAELAEAAARQGLAHEISGLQSFRPGRPVPTHRMSASPPVST